MLRVVLVSPNSKLRRLFRSPIALCVLTYVLGIAVLVAVNFPYTSDVGAPRPQASANRAFYEDVYSPEEQRKQAEYVEIDRRAAEAGDVKARLRMFIDRRGLKDARVLEVGAGSGFLQDVVENYTGLDISANARRYFHKPFVQGDARVLPFRNNEFDAVWTIWVLEHVPHPEQALYELRRVVRPGGYIYLAPAWRCSSLAAEGYGVRPYSDFSLTGKLVKASIPIRQSPLVMVSYLIPIRALRLAAWKIVGGPTTLHYRAITPNYEHYWVPDSDAVNSLDNYEAYLWFASRGDKCLNCEGWRQIMAGGWEMEIQVVK